MSALTSSGATREAYGHYLAELGERHPKIVVMDADLSGSTKTAIFAKKFPERFINVGVAEQDLMGTAAGLAQSGFKVFTSTFTMFATGRAWEIVRQSIAYPKFDVKICSSHAGITVGEDGASHQSLEDIALMRVIPNMKVFVPADAAQTRHVMDLMLQDSGPCFMRLSRAPANDVFLPTHKFLHGEILRQGQKVCLFVTGFLTRNTLDAAQLLSNKGLNVTVVNIANIKPLPQDLVVQMAKTHDLLFSIEEHSVVGGFGSALAEILSTHCPKKLFRIGFNDEFGQSGTYQDLLKHYRLDVAGLSEQITHLIP